MRRILGSEGPLLDAPPTVEEPAENRSVTLSAMNAEEPTADARRRRMVIPDFEETFLKPLDIRNRSALYVSSDTKRKILDVVRRVGSDRMTATSYLENILRHHFITNQLKIQAMTHNEMIIWVVLIVGLSDA